MTKIDGCSVIYQPGGRALEYADLAVNLFRGCPHGCAYCYAPSVLRMKKDDFHAQAQPRKDILKKLERDAKVLRDRGETRRILLCFTCDPYPPDRAARDVTRQAIEILEGHYLNIQILTKGGSRAMWDIGWFTQDDAFATTLTLWDDDWRWEAWEPRAASPTDRLNTIKAFRRASIPTWVSLEPVIDPAVSLKIIEITHPWVDLFKVGKLNYAGRLPPVFRQQVQDIDWRTFAQDAVALLEMLGKAYLIKDDLKVYLPEVRR